MGNEDHYIPGVFLWALLGQHELFWRGERILGQKGMEGERKGRV